MDNGTASTLDEEATLDYGRQVIHAVLPNIVLQTVILFMGFVGNASVLYIYMFKMKDKQTESRYFIPFLTCYDLLSCMASLTFFLSDTFMWVTFYSDIYCKFCLFILMLTTMTSNGFLLAIAIQRYLKICRPLRKQMDLFWRRLSVCLIIIVSLIYSCPMTVFSEVRELSVVYKGRNVSGPSCFSSSQRYTTVNTIYLGLLFIVVIVNIVATAGFYLPIGIEIYKRFHGRRRQLQMAEVGTSSSMETEESCFKKEGNINKKLIRSTPETNFNSMFLAIISIYLLSYMPTCVMQFITAIDDQLWIRATPAEFGIFNWLYRSFAINHSANPYVYAYFDIGLRNEIMKIFGRGRNL